MGAGSSQKMPFGRLWEDAKENPAESHDPAGRRYDCTNQFIRKSIWLPRPAAAGMARAAALIKLAQQQHQGLLEPLILGRQGRDGGALFCGVHSDISGAAGRRSRPLAVLADVLA
jgi:hypothetical protein